MTQDPRHRGETAPRAEVSPTIAAVHRHVRERPEAIAAIDADGSVVSFGELWARAERASSMLDIERGEIVGVELRRSVDVVVAMVAVQLAGGVYAPFSPDDPPARTADLQRRIGLRHVFTSEAGPLSLRTLRSTEPAVLDMSGSPAEQPLYVMWTSGSTGEPKAVVIAHRGVRRLIDDHEFMDIGTDDRVAFASNPMFDAATWEIWASLGNGAGLVVIDGDDLVDAARMRTRIESTGVTRAFITTSLFNHLTRTDPGLFSDLRSVAVGGEPLSPSSLRTVLASGSAPGELLNGYGPTECTTFAVWHRIDEVAADAVRIPIGRPILHTELAVVDPEGTPVADGMEGELWIAGDGVAIGYLGAAELQERFVDRRLPGHTGDRWYRTGDLVVRLPDGTLDCLGRIDRQLKVHGYRIEPTEIEQAIEAQVGVRTAAVIANRAGSTISLLGFVVPEGGTIDTEPILAALRTSLPAFMVPARLLVVDSLPTTPNGKLDERRLLELAATALAEPPEAEWREALLHPTVRFVLECARTVLGSADLRVDDDLWAAGLDSLSAIELLDLISEGDFGEFDTPDFDGLATPEELAAVLRGHRTVDVTTTAETTAVLLNRGGTRPAMFAIPGAAGTSSIYRPLAHALGDDQPIVVIGPRGMHRPGPVDRTIEHAAAHVVAEITARLEPGRPCVLLGYSSGASIAFAAAQVLHGSGVDVRLVLLDAVPGVTEGPELAAVRPVPYVFDAAETTPAALGPLDRVRAALRERRRRRVEQRFLDDPGPPSFEPERYAAFLRIARTAVAEYRPEPAPFAATLIRVDLGPLERLGEHLVTRLDVHVVGGDHATMLMRRHVHEIVAVLRPILDATATP